MVSLLMYHLFLKLNLMFFIYLYADGTQKVQSNICTMEYMDLVYVYFSLPIKCKRHPKEESFPWFRHFYRSKKARMSKVKSRQIRYEWVLIGSEVQESSINSYTQVTSGARGTTPTVGVVLQMNVSKAGSDKPCEVFTMFDLDRHLSARTFLLLSPCFFPPVNVRHPDGLQHCSELFLLG